jgi:hypothetical protein
MTNEETPKWNSEDAIDKDLIKELVDAMINADADSIMDEYRMQVTGNNCGSPTCNWHESKCVWIDFLRSENVKDFKDYMVNYLGMEKNLCEWMLDENYESLHVLLLDWAVSLYHSEIMELIEKALAEKEAV